MRALAAGRQIASLWEVSGRAARAYGESRLAIARRARRVRLQGAWRYEEALGEGLLDPAMAADVRRRHISQHAREGAQRRLNPDALALLTEDKLGFHRYCDALGIPAPVLHGTVGRTGGWSAATGRGLPDASAFARMVRDELPDAFVVKPVDGYLGRGVHAIAKEQGGLRVADGRLLGPEALHAELLADPVFSLFLVQERLWNHPDLAGIHASPVLQTARLVTFIGTDGSIRLLAAWIKLALGGGSSDNYSDGGGNAKVVVDAASGLLGSVYAPRPDGLGSVETTAVPATGRDLRGLRLPLFDAARDLVLAAAPHFLPMRTLGWDIGLTPRGPVVIEANNYWGHAGIPLGPAVIEALNDRP